VRRPRLIATACLAALALAAPVGAYEAITVKDGGTVTGVVRFVGTPPTLSPIPVNKNRDVCGDQKPSEAIVDNRNCVFVGHVTAVVPGDRVRVRNLDPILHNTHGYLGQPTVFNLALPNKDQMIDITKRLGKPGVVRVLCDAHPHMFAWMLVHDSPYVAVTDAAGAFRIGDVPPGTYKVTMWHAGFRPKGNDKDGRPLYDEPRTVTKELTIAPKATATVEYELR